MTEEQTDGQMTQDVDLMQFVPKVHFEQIPIRTVSYTHLITDSFQGRYCRYALLMHYICQRCLRHIRELCKSVFGDFMLAA